MKRISVASLVLGALALLGAPAIAEPKPKAKPNPKPDTIKRVKKAKSIAALLTTRRVSMSLEKVSLPAFLKFMRASVGINIVLDKARIEKDGGDVDSIEITLKLNDVRAIDALKLALEGQELGLTIKGNVLLITSKKAARGKPILRIYNVSDLLIQLRDFPAPDINIHPSSYEPPEAPEPVVTQNFETSDELAELVRQFTGRETWEDEGVTITVFKRHLFIRTYPAVHNEILRFLAKLPR